MKLRQLTTTSSVLRIGLIFAVAAVALAGLSGCFPQPQDVLPTPEQGSARPEEEVTEPLRPLVSWVVLSLEVAGIVAIVIGTVVATVIFAYTLLHREPGPGRLLRYREHLGQVILLGLEFLVAADIVGTVAVIPNFRTVGALALVILVRTFLSFTLEVETTGYWPWQRRGGRRE